MGNKEYPSYMGLTERTSGPDDRRIDFALKADETGRAGVNSGYARARLYCSVYQQPKIYADEIIAICAGNNVIQLYKRQNKG